jgi:hypothetical protein
MVWIQSSFVGRLYFFMDEIVCISHIEMNVILVVVDIQNIHENKKHDLKFSKIISKL